MPTTVPNHLQAYSVVSHGDGRMTWAIFPDDKYKTALIELLTASSERATAVVGGALLEEAIDRTLRERLLDIPVCVDSLLEVDRPLGNMSPKIDLLHLLGAFDETARVAMKGIAGVRNFFAHHLDASFGSLDRQFTRPMQRLTLHESRTYYPHHLFGPDSNVAIEPVNSKREQFIVNLKLALIILMRDRISHHPYTNRPRSEEELLQQYPNRYSAEE
jgi:DNA-binding MltR family transcriptional regulator